MPIVVGYLPTPEGEAALAGAAGEAKMRGAGLTIVPSGHDDEQEFPTGEHENLLDGIDYDIVDPGTDADVAESLIATAEERNADLIVIGLRQRNPVGKLILGANAQRILLDAGCPVLTVKPNR